MIWVRLTTAVIGQLPLEILCEQFSSCYKLKSERYQFQVNAYNDLARIRFDIEEIKLAVVPC